MGAFDGYISAMIARLSVLLVGRLVLLVDDDEAELSGGGENRGARSDNYAALARGNAEPLAAALTRSEPRMQDTNSRQASGETLDGLGGQGDLRNEDDGLAVAADELFDATNIDFSLAGAGDAVEEVNRKTGIGQYAVQTAQGLLLLRV